MNDMSVQVIRSKHRCGQDLISEVKASANSLNLWWDIVNDWDNV